MQHFYKRGAEMQNCFQQAKPDVLNFITFTPH